MFIIRACLRIRIFSDIVLRTVFSCDPALIQCHLLHGSLDSRPRLFSSWNDLRAGKQKSQTPAVAQLHDVGVFDASHTLGPVVGCAR